MAALACPAVHMSGCAPNYPPCRASAYGCLARRMLPMAVLPSPDCTVENFAWRENSGKEHRLLPLARLLQSCVREVAIRRIFGVCAPPFQTLSTPPFQQVYATFFATSPDASAKLRNRHDLYCRQSGKLRRSSRCYYGRC